jgi:DNA polymerase sigma
VPFLHTKRRQDLYRVYNPALLAHLDLHEDPISSTIKVDITINVEGITSQGFESTVLMKNWISQMPVLQKLVLIFKHILSVRGFNSNFAGGIGSYCLFVMIAAYLKTFAREQDMSLSDCFQNILKWYGEDFNNIGHAIRLQEEGNCFIDDLLIRHEIEEGKVGLLKIVDPITARLMSSSCHEYSNIRAEFRRINA